MANIKITDLDAYADPKSTDVLPAVDVTNDETKKVSIADLMENAGSGTEAAPGIAFDGDPNTGIYRPGADQLAISTAGTQRLLISDTGAVTIPGDLTVQGTTTTIDSETLVVKDKNIELGVVDSPTDTTADGGGITLKGATDKTINWVNATDAWTSSERFDFPAGTEAAPSIILNGDTNTGIYSPGADQVAVATNGVGRLFISSTGQIGIGGAPSGSNLNIIDPVPTIRLTDSDTNGYSHVLQSDTSLYLDADRGAAATGALIVRTNGTNERLRITSTGQLSHIGGGSSGSPAVGFNGSAPSNSLVVDSLGKVGIGVSSPDGQLVIGNTSFSKNRPDSGAYVASSVGGDYYGLVLHNQSTAGAGTVIIEGRLGQAALSNTSAGKIIFGKQQTWNNTGSTRDSYLAFWTTENAVENERLRITSAGNVGIGTASPDGTLHAHTASAGTVTPWANADDLIVENNGPTGISILAPDTEQAQIIFGNPSDNIGSIIRWKQDENELQVGTHKTDGFLTFRTAIGQERARIDSSGTFRIKGAGTAGVNDAFAVNGSAPSNSLVVDSTGRVGIGTSSPGTGNLLHIADTSKAATDRTGVKLQSTNSLAANTGLPLVWSGNIGTQSDYTWASITGRKENATSGQAGGYLQFATGSSGGAVEERVRITSAGLVGIGNSSPSGLLDLAGTKNLSSDIGQIIVRDSASYATGVGGAVVLAGKYNSGGSYTAGAYLNARKENSTDGNYSFALGFGTIANGGAISEKMTLDSSGRLGIGTGSPSNPIHVTNSSSSVATAYFNNTSTGGDSPSLIVQGGANNAGTVGTFEVRDYSGNTDFKVQGDGKVGILLQMPDLL
jgi:hypothetical protein